LFQLKDIKVVIMLCQNAILLLYVVHCHEIL